MKSVVPVTHTVKRGGSTMNSFLFSGKTFLMLYVVHCCCCWMVIALTPTWCHWSLQGTKTWWYFACPHASHECQTLDCSLFKPLKDHWRQECHRFYCKHPRTVIRKINFNFVFRNAWLNAITPTNVVSGFRKTGVYPFNRHAISCASTYFCYSYS